MLIVDAHEDLAYNALVDGRNYLQSAHATRAVEAVGPVPALNGECMLGLPEWLEAGVAVIFATIAVIPASAAQPGEAGYNNVAEAHSQALAQLEIYRSWVAAHPQLALITNQRELVMALGSWSASDSSAHELDRRQVGLILLIENADAIREPTEVEYWHEQGVRLIGPAWQSNRYTGADNDPGPLTDLGRELLTEMERLGMILDISHMADEAALESLDRYNGPVVATHANPRRLVPIRRLISDEVIASLVARDGVIGAMPLNWALDPTWKQHYLKKAVAIDRLVDAIDTICEIAGNAYHVGLGTDFDGGTGAEGTPAELDTIADLPILADALARRGYEWQAIEGIMGGNWLRLLRRHLPVGADGYSSVKS
jgi:membrane dipeptidase